MGMMRQRLVGMRLVWLASMWALSVGFAPPVALTCPQGDAARQKAVSAWATSRATSPTEASLSQEDQLARVVTVVETALTLDASSLFTSEQPRPETRRPATRVLKFALSERGTSLRRLVTEQLVTALDVIGRGGVHRTTAMLPNRLRSAGAALAPAWTDDEVPYVDLLRRVLRSVFSDPEDPFRQLVDFSLGDAPVRAAIPFFDLALGLAVSGASGFPEDRPTGFGDTLRRSRFLRPIVQVTDAALGGITTPEARRRTRDYAVLIADVVRDLDPLERSVLRASLEAILADLRRLSSDRLDNAGIRIPRAAAGTLLFPLQLQRALQNLFGSASSSGAGQREGRATRLPAN